jgi:hypothetical protein
MHFGCHASSSGLFERTGYRESSASAASSLGIRAKTFPLGNRNWSQQSVNFEIRLSHTCPLTQQTIWNDAGLLVHQCQMDCGGAVMGYSIPVSDFPQNVTDHSHRRQKSSMPLPSCNEHSEVPVILETLLRPRLDPSWSANAIYGRQPTQLSYYAICTIADRSRRA